MKTKMLSLIIPTYNERENIGLLIPEIDNVLRKNSIKAEIIVVDDNSPDGTADVVREIMKKQRSLHLIERGGKKGLASAVLDGIKVSKNEIIGVMDADFSHRPEDVASLYRAINTQIYGKMPDFVIGSRYVRGGRIIGWGLYRKVVSRGASFLARSVTKARDPVSGFLMIRKHCLNGKNFNPKGFKIGLEFLVKADWHVLKEVPIAFNDRMKGRSKFSFYEYYSYLSNLAGYVVLKINKKC